MFKVNNKDTRTTPMAWFCSSVSIVNFEKVIAGWEALGFSLTIVAQNNDTIRVSANLSEFITNSSESINFKSP